MVEGTSFSLIGIERDGEATSLPIAVRPFDRLSLEHELTYRADLIDIHHDHRARARVPLLGRDELSVLLRSKLINGSWKTVSGTCALVCGAVTFPEEPYNSWGPVECVEHDGDPAVLTYMRDGLDSWDYVVSSQSGGMWIEWIHVPLPVRSSYHTLRSFMTWNDPATPFGDTLM